MERNLDDYIEVLVGLRDNRSDEIPNKFISSGDAPDNKYKVRTVFITILVALLENIELTDYKIAIQNTLSPTIELSNNRDKDKQHITTTEEISEINRIIDITIEELEKLKTDN